MAQKITYNIDVNPGNSVQTLGQLEEELAQINDELKEVPLNSKAFDDLTKKSQAVTKSLDKANMAISGLTDEDKIRGFQGSIDVLGGSLSAVTGAAGLLNIESEEFEKYTNYAANVIAFTSGLRTGVQGLVDMRSALIKSTAAQKLFNLQVLKNPYVAAAAAIIATLTAVLAFSKDIRVAIGLQKEEAVDLTEEYEKQLQASEDNSSILEAEKTLLEAQGEDLGEINKLIRDELLLQIDITEQLLIQQQLRLEESQEEDKRLTFWEALGVKAKSYFSGVSEAALAANVIVNKGTSDATLEVENRIQELRLKLLNLKTELIGAESDAQDRPDVETVGEIVPEGVAEMEGAKLKVKALDMVTAAQLIATRAVEDATKAAEEQALAEAERNRLLGLSAAAFQTLSGVIGTETAAGKALASASALINTYLGVTQVLDDDKLPTLLKIPLAVGVAAAGLATVKKINAVQVPGGPQGGGASPAGVTAPAIPQLPQDFGISPETDFASQPVRAYVVSGDVTTTQEAEAKLNAKRTLGS